MVEKLTSKELRERIRDCGFPPPIHPSTQPEDAYLLLTFVEIREQLESVTKAIQRNADHQRQLVCELLPER